MFPVLISVGDFIMPSYHVFVAAGFLLGIYYGVYISKQSINIVPVQIIDLAFFIGAGALFGARLGYVFFSDLEYFKQNPWQVLAVWTGGYVYYGGLIGATLSAFAFMAFKKMPRAETSDIGALGTALGTGFGRLACFAAGCCYGKQTDLPFPLSVTFPEHAKHLSQAEPLGLPLHPTQLYSSLLHMGLFFFLLWFRARKRRHGELFVLYVALYGIGRYLIETLRGDDIRGLFFERAWSSSQILALLTGTVGLLFFIYLRWHASRNVSIS